MEGIPGMASTRKTKDAQKAAASYTSASIDDAQGLDHIRLRPSMYLGDVDKMLRAALREIIDNAVDEALVGFGDDIAITFFKDGSAQVEDSGRGIPVDMKNGISGIEMCVGRKESGGKFNTSNYAQSGGLNGVGASATNACSVRFDVTVYRDGNEYTLSFKEGHAGHFARANDPKAAFEESHEVRVRKDPRPAAERKRRPTGTTIRFWPDFTVFTPGTDYMRDDIRFRMKSTAFLIPGLTITITDETEPTDDGQPRVDVYESDGGLADMLPTLTNDDLLTKPITLHAESSFSAIGSTLVDGKIVKQETERPVSMDVSFSYTTSEDTIIKSYVDIIQTREGGTHVDGLWQALSRCFRNYIKGTQGMLKKNEEPPTMDDIRAGFVGLISINVPEPDFAGNAKDSFSTPQVKNVVSQEIGKELTRWLSDKKNDAQAKKLGKRIVEASRERLAQRKMKDTMRKKAALDSPASRPDKLVECRKPGAPMSELFICEGDSALGTIKEARNSDYQAVFPVRGKGLNVFKAASSKVYGNAEYAGIISALGAGSGRDFNVDQLRYRSVHIATDADVDGAHICSLLLAFFFRYMRPMIEQGRVYVIESPLFLTKVKGKDGKIRVIPSIDDAEHDKVLKGIERRGETVVKENRFKGLGELDAEEMGRYCMDPETRVVRRVTEGDEAEALRVLNLTMGPHVDPRRDWIFESMGHVDEEDIDA